ncbi:WAT1-related protein At3g30340-like isoform X2 [Tripterygium wilfordii]|uniref:WAT1-related protein At3g30340-like isoform X2 n=1 Tax=Tripterygium wilfordii TaxID=458696 RepID=UPI0018F82E3D|nr:WAT1-related protein At3g30340-like isoform X2 [Tripterygium wilfordii]
MVNVLIKKMLDDGMNHMVIVTYRQSIATIFLAPIAYFWEGKSERQAKVTASILCMLFFSALVGITLTQYLFLLGLKRTTSSLSCAILNTVPICTFVLALPFGLEKVNLKIKAGKAKVLGMLICLGGTVLLILYKGTPLTSTAHSRATINSNASTSAKKTEDWVIGSALLMAGSLFWSSWFLIQTKIGKRYPSKYSSNTILSFFGAIQSAIVCLITGSRNINMWLLKGTWQIIGALYTGMVGSGLCYLGMSWCVKQRGPVFTAAFTPLMQIFAAIFDISVLHEQLFLGSILGSVLVVLGLYILLWGKSIETLQCDSKPVQVSKEDGDRDVV